MDANQTEDLRLTPAGPTRGLMGRRLRRLAVAAVTSAALIGGAVATAGNAAAQPNTSCVAYFAAAAASDMESARRSLAEATTDDAEGNYAAAVDALNSYHSAITSYGGARYAQSLC